MRSLAALMVALLALLAAPTSARAEEGGLKALTKPKADNDTPHFLPTLAAAIGFDAGTDALAYGTFWLGASHYPLSQPWSPFYSVGGALDLRTVPDGDANRTVVVLGPEVRGGISFFPDNNGYISLLNVYGLLGYRAASAFDRGAFRVGVGISSPGLGLAVFSSGLTLPWMLEGTLDVTLTDTRISGRVGVSY